jgi:hypothetical protein
MITTPPNKPSPTYTVYLEKLCQQLILDEEGYEILKKTMLDYESMVNTQAMQDLDNKDYDF